MQIQSQSDKIAQAGVHSTTTCKNFRGSTHPTNLFATDSRWLSSLWRTERTEGWNPWWVPPRPWRHCATQDRGTGRWWLEACQRCGEQIGRKRHIFGRGQHIICLKLLQRSPYPRGVPYLSPQPPRPPTLGYPPPGLGPWPWIPGAPI